jgi:Ni,Fe-hydrogenase III large subunit
MISPGELGRMREILADVAPVVGHRPWPRGRIGQMAWDMAVDKLVTGELTMLSLWADAKVVHMALLVENSAEIAVVSLACTDGSFPSVGARHPPALRFERAIRDLYGIEAVASPDKRPWLDFGFWGVKHPLGDCGGAPVSRLPYTFLPTEGENLHQIAVGPVHAGTIEPGHFRFTASGETVVRLEQRLGYVHKGVEALLIGAPLDRATQLAARASGDSTVAYALAFARAAEAALGIKIPARANWLRALMAELERIANHLGDFGAICNDASFVMMHAQCGMLRERVLRASNACFGHRLMMDCVVPGGTAVDLPKDGTENLRSLVFEIRELLPKLVELYDMTASLQDRTVKTGILTSALARQYGAGGYVGRASGRTFDARRAMQYPPYNELKFDVPVLLEGDVNARVWIRIREIEASLSLIEQILGQIPGGAFQDQVEASPSSGIREGMALVEGFRGDVLAWVKFDVSGRLSRCHLRDPSWFQWPLLEAAIEGNIVADFPLCNKSFNCSYSGHDL